MTDVLIVNPPSPDGHIYIRDVCRWGRKSREKMIWPQTSLAYIAAMVPQHMTVRIIDAIAEKIGQSAKNADDPAEHGEWALSMSLGILNQVNANKYRLPLRGQEMKSYFGNLYLASSILW